MADGDTDPAYVDFDEFWEDRAKIDPERAHAVDVLRGEIHALAARNWRVVKETREGYEEWQAEARRSARKTRRVLLALAVWSLAVGVVGIIAISNSGSAGRRAATALVKVQQGRRTGQRITCAVESAFADAGRAVIGQTANPGVETPLTRFLEVHGYPSLKQRKAEATAAANSYVTGISSRIEKAIGHAGDGLVRMDGTIDCQKLANLSALGSGVVK